VKPVIALVGRPNVGKSTLFNRLTRTHDALVADIPGFTRDRHYGHGKLGTKAYFVVDTGGLEPQVKSGIFHAMARQTTQAIDEADAVIFIVDARAGLLSQDCLIAKRLRASGKRVWLAVNKTEGMDKHTAAAEFHELGMNTPQPVSAAHGEGVAELMRRVLDGFEQHDEPAEKERRHPSIAIIGRPNVGKSTLVNAILGEERVLVYDEPGTTRDSVYIDIERNEKKYTVIDTAGIRRRGKVFETQEKFSVVKTLQAIEHANVVVLMLDAQQSISEQDARIAGHVLERGRAVVVAVNKWDGLAAAARETVKREISHKLDFLDFADLHFISALHQRGIAGLFGSIDAAYQAAMTRIPTPRLTRTLTRATTEHAPPKKGLFRPRLRYAHQGGVNPPLIIIHGSGFDRLSASYRRYLENVFRKTFCLQGTPLRIEFRVTENPYAGRVNKPEKRRTVRLSQ
jgi:GTP-binding protein